MIGAPWRETAAGRACRSRSSQQNDFAGATSSKSTQVDPRRIRYLPHLRFGWCARGCGTAGVATHRRLLYSDLDFVIPLFEDRGLVDLRPGCGRAFPLTHATGGPIPVRPSRWPEPRGAPPETRSGRRVRPVPEAAEGRTQEGFVYRDAQTTNA